MAPPRPPRSECERHVCGPPVIRLTELRLEEPEISRVTGGVPGCGDRLIDQRRLDVINGAPAPAHAPDHGGQHREAFLAVIRIPRGRGRIDHRETD